MTEPPEKRKKEGALSATNTQGPQKKQANVSLQSAYRPIITAKDSPGQASLVNSGSDPPILLTKAQNPLRPTGKASGDILKQLNWVSSLYHAAPSFTTRQLTEGLSQIFGKSARRGSVTHDTPVTDRLGAETRLKFGTHPPTKAEQARKLDLTFRQFHIFS